MRFVTQSLAEASSLPTAPIYLTHWNWAICDTKIDLLDRSHIFLYHLGKKDKLWRYNRNSLFNADLTYYMDAYDADYNV